MTLNHVGSGFLHTKHRGATLLTHPVGQFEVCSQMTFLCKFSVTLLALESLHSRMRPLVDVEVRSIRESSVTLSALIVFWGRMGCFHVDLGKE